MSSQEERRLGFLLELLQDFLGVLRVVPKAVGGALGL